MGIAREKAQHEGGARGMVGRGRGGAPPTAGGGGLLFGRWWLAAQGDGV